MQVPVATLHEAIARSRPDQDCIVAGATRRTWSEVTDRTRRLANTLIDAGLGCHTERDRLENWESGQDHLAIYLHNGPEYLEAMLAAFKARVAPFNVNYRYVADELRYLLRDASARAVVIHSAFAPLLAEIRSEIPSLAVIVQVPDASGNPLLDGAIWYEDAVASGSPEPPPVNWSPDDLYILYTGGTTGMPKGVLWRNGDAVVECFGGRRDVTSVEDMVSAAAGQLRALPAPPFMHGAGQWIAMRTFFDGGCVVIPNRPERLDAADLWSTVEREQVNFLLIVGDAFARPLLDELDRHDYDLSSLTVILSGGAALTSGRKAEFLSRLPTAMVVDGLGSSEAGGQLSQVSTGTTATTGTFPLTESNHVLSADLTRVLAPGDPELGWLAKSGRLALGYLGDAAKTARTYPTIGSMRFAVPGDRARLLEGGIVELHGRDSATINSGGEKIFAEEVEAALKTHPGVADCVVAARPHDRFGHEVVAIVAVRAGVTVTDEELVEAAGGHLARYKLPRAIIRVDEVLRSPAGKADYRWAGRVACGDVEAVAPEAV